jgi:hypothetical protein
MNKSVSLKLQLAEAAKYIRTESPSHQRLAIILLDNFIELQLSSKLDEKLIYDSILPIAERKYNTKRLKSISRFHKELVEACVEEQIITSKESSLLTFCHEIRNKHYHHGKDDSVLTQVSVKFLYDIILKYQPKWQAGFSIIMSSDKQEEDPFPVGAETGVFMSYPDRWQMFLQEYFICKNMESINVSALLSDFLVERMYKTQDAINFIESEGFPDLFPQKDWNFKKLLFHYSLMRDQKHSIALAKENTDKLAYNSQIKKIIEKYRETWMYKRVGRVETLLRWSKSISSMGPYTAFNKFLTYRDEVMTFYHATTDAAGDLSEILDAQAQGDY